MNILQQFNILIEFNLFLIITRLMNSNERENFQSGTL